MQQRTAPHCPHLLALDAAEAGAAGTDERGVNMMRGGGEVGGPGVPDGAVGGDIVRHMAFLSRHGRRGKREKCERARRGLLLDSAPGGAERKYPCAWASACGSRSVICRPLHMAASGSARTEAMRSSRNQSIRGNSGARRQARR